MTRDYNNQRREYPHSDSRGSSSHRFEEKRSSRPARPRLNRDMVDRAWENGARQNHADYRTRSDNKTHSTRDNRRPDQQTNRYSAQNNSNGHNPYGNRQDNYRPGERSPRRNNGSRPHKFESGMRTFDDQHYNQYERRGYPKETYQDDYHPGDSWNNQHPHARTQYQGRDQYRGAQRHEFERDTSSPRHHDRDQRQARSYDRNPRPPRSYDRDKRSSRNMSGPDTRNLRRQSRSERREDNYSNRPHEYSRFKAEQELFEGDYEQFGRSNFAQPHAQALHVSKERNVRRLPNGRVLKGTPDEQQQKAEFWTEIAQESDELVKQVELSHAQEVTTQHSGDHLTVASTRRKTNPRTRKANESTQERKATKAKMRESKPKARSTGPKPSQRGFKWPTPEE